MKKKYFSKYKKLPIELPSLVKNQIDSFDWVIEKGVRELFEEFFPIDDYTGKEMSLEFVDFSIGKPKADEYQSKINNLTYEAPLKIRVKLNNKELGTDKEQEIFLADFPIMTSRGTFIINGVERVIVQQLARSFGVYFSAEMARGKKCFGAKIIPGRGAWIEIETDAYGVLYARLDRGRKFPVTSLLKVFGIGGEKEIRNAFSKIDKGEVRFIENTLQKDPAKTEEDSYKEIYTRLRPGEPVNFESAKSYIEAMFLPARYDLSLVGRYRINQSLGLPVDDIKSFPRVITLSDLVAIISKIIESNNTPGAQQDDIDHLGSRRVRGVGELLQQRMRVGMARMRKNIQDRMSTLEVDTLTPSQLVNNRPFMAILKEFFATNQLSQFMGQKNILDEIEHLRRLSAMGPGGLTRERAGFEVRDVHPSHYGRICPIQTPEGPNIGLVVQLSVHARLNEFGILETPYRKVKNGKITKEIVYLNALDEAKFNIAHAGINYNEETGEILEEEIEARVNSNPGLIEKSKVDFVDLSANQAYSIATSLIPFLEHDDATRALMGSNMQRQAVPCIASQAPRVSTGMEDRAALDSGRLIVCEKEGEVESVDGSKVTVKENGGKKRTYNLINFMRSNAFTATHQRPSVNVGDKVSKGDVLADNYSSENGQLALGQNVMVAFLSWGGANFEDAIIISERLVKNDIFSSVSIEDYTIDVRDTKLGPEITTRDIPNVGEEKLKNLDEEGIVRIGAEVRAGDILVGKITPKGETELTPEERLLRFIFGEKARDVKDTSKRLDHGRQGRVIGIKIFSREKGDKLDPGIIKRIQVEIAQLRKISVGDKIAGRHGNKGVISKILPVEDMPHFEDGTHVDVILNPLGISGRMNLGQVLETHLGWAADKLNYQAVCPVFCSPTEKEIKEELKKAGLPESGKVKLYDGRNGDLLEQEVTAGIMYMMKLDHMVEDKIHMRSIGPYSLITQQPLGGKAQGGGQRFGEMEVWALEGHGVAHILQEMLTIKSDDILGRAAVYDSIIRGEKFKNPNLPASFHVLLNELKGLALDVELTDLKEQIK